MALGDFLARLGGGGHQAPEPTPPPEPTPAAPSRDDLGAALDRVEAMVAGDAVPSCVTARVERVTHVVRDTIPRLGAIRGSASAYSVVATATDYLPEALGGYLRLPRRFADSRPVDGGRTSLMVLVDQLDLLGATMDQVFDAVCRDDATALVAHGRFLDEKFGHAASGGELNVGTSYAVPPPPGALAETLAAQAPEPVPADPPAAAPLAADPMPAQRVGLEALAEPATPESVPSEPATPEAAMPEAAMPEAAMPEAAMPEAALPARPGPDEAAPAAPAASAAPESPAAREAPSAPAPEAPRRSMLDLDDPAPGSTAPGPGEPQRLAPPSWP